MNKTFENIAGLFKSGKFKSDRRVVVFIICIFIATVLWFLNALSKDYSTEVSYPVKYLNAPKNQFLANKPPTKFELKVEGHGFTLLRHKLSLTFSPIVINLSNVTQDLEHTAGVYNINSKSLIRKISSQVSSEITITEIQPDFFQLVFDSLKSKTVPVELEVRLDFKPQFNLRSPLMAVPKEVEITGPSNLLDTIFSVKTKARTFSKIDSDFENSIELLTPSGVNVSPSNVLVKVLVEKFTEKELKIPIQIINKPSNTDIKIFPSEIKVLFSIGLNEFDRIKPSDFEAFVNCDSIVSGAEYMRVTLSKQPFSNEPIRFTPERVEYLIETK